MRWNCPHCGVALAVTDEKLGHGWSFSRCYKCGGFALIRRSDINLIKVDRAPTGERVLLPEATEFPMIAKAAADRLLKPVVRPANGRRAEPQAAAPPPIGAKGTGNFVATPMATSAMAALESVEPKASVSVAQAHPRATAAPRPSAKVPYGLPEALPNSPTRSWKERMLPVAIAATGILAIASGFYLYLQGRQVWRAASQAAETASAPQAPADETILARSPAEEAKPVVIDRINQQAMAPVPGDPNGEGEEGGSLTIRIRAAKAFLRGGPGTEYPIVGVGNPEILYTVRDFKDRWFKILVPSGSQPVAWIRNDLVEVQASTP